MKEMNGHPDNPKAEQTEAGDVSGEELTSKLHAAQVTNYHI